MLGLEPADQRRAEAVPPSTSCDAKPAMPASAMHKAVAAGSAASATAGGWSHNGGLGGVRGGSLGGSSVASDDPFEALFRELDADGSDRLEYGEFQRVLGGGITVFGEPGSTVRTALPKEPRLQLAERRWPKSERELIEASQQSSGDAMPTYVATAATASAFASASTKAVREDFMQIRLCGAEPGSKRYATMDGLMAAQVELGVLSAHLAPHTVIPLVSYFLTFTSAADTLSALWLSDVAPEEDLPKDVVRFGDLPTKSPIELRLRAHNFSAHMHSQPPKLPTANGADRGHDLGYACNPESPQDQSDALTSVDALVTSCATCSARLELFEMHFQAPDHRNTLEGALLKLELSLYAMSAFHRPTEMDSPPQVSKLSISLLSSPMMSPSPSPQPRCPHPPLAIRHHPGSPVHARREWRRHGHD